MNRPMKFASTAIILTLAARAAFSATTLPPEQADFFEKRIRPVLASECTSPPHCPTPVRVLTVSGAAGAKANS